MKQVYDNLFVGDVNDADNPKKQRQNDVNYILNVADTSTEQDSAPSFDNTKEVNYINIPLTDDGENTDYIIDKTIRLARDMYEQAQEEDVSMLVHCNVGSSRSVAIAASLMSLENRKVVKENVNRVKKVRPIANPHEELLNQVSRITADIHNE